MSSQAKSHKSVPNSQLSLDGKTLSKMREIAEGVFMDNFHSIVVARSRQHFVVFIEKGVPDRTIVFFKQKYTQCKVKFCEDA